MDVGVTEEITKEWEYTVRYGTLVDGSASTMQSLPHLYLYNTSRDRHGSAHREFYYIIYNSEHIYL